MKSSKYFMVELLAVLKNKKILIPVLAVALVPLLYSSMFLWAFWDPYAKLDTLPVAVVNEDKGATFEGKTMKLGDEFAGKIKETKGFNWNFVTKEEAEQGLKDNKYYLGIEIPANFSEKATNVLDEHPDKAVFRFYPNESYNFLSSQIGKTAVDRMKAELSSELTKAYTETVFANISKLSDGLSQAASGALKLSDGTKSIETGIATIDENISKLAQGTLPLKSGANELLSGAGQLQTGILQLKQGAGQLTTGLTQLEQGHGQLREGAKQAEAGTAQLKSGLDSAAEGAEKLNAGAAGLTAGMEQFAQAHPELAQDPAYLKLVGTAKALAEGAGSLSTGQKQLADGTVKLLAGENQLVAGMDLFAQKLGEAKQGGAALASGAGSLSQGGAKLESGLTQLSGGVEQLSDGTMKLEEGSKKLSEGAATVATGTNELSGKLQEASDKTSGIKGSDDMFDKVASPIQVEEEKLNPVPNYGTGFAPYFVSLGLFVGALLLTIVFPLRDPAGMPKSGMALFFGKFGFMLVVGAIQAVVVNLVLLYGLGIEVKSVPLFFLFSLMTSWTYMALIQLFVTTMGDPGRFVAIVILILQLTTSAGTFPVELIPDALQHVTAWLPMTYSVSGYKAVISSGDYGFLWQNIGILAMFTGLCAILTMSYFIIRHKRQPSALLDRAEA
ncbi:YhgE/Pip family protein [Paenibacillus sp. MBLB4367]|uniref:YhgE/Pip family protein n=1 Tax=Paenibacillus sp. MBLB4367 TaxID=3384767 RepID=UPI0039083A79